jgi:hypothetical protein
VDNQVVLLLAGPLTEEKAIGTVAKSLATTSDRKQAIALVRWLHPTDRQADAYLSYLTIVTEDILAIPSVWVGVESITEVLRTREGRVSAQEVQDLADFLPGADY